MVSPPLPQHHRLNENHIRPVTCSSLPLIKDYCHDYGFSPKGPAYVGRIPMEDMDLKKKTPYIAELSSTSASTGLPMVLAIDLAQ